MAALKERIREVATLQAAVSRCTAVVDFGEGTPTYPPTVNHPSAYAFARGTVERLLGDGRMREVPPSLAAEDFSYYAEKVPGCLLWLGIRNESAGAVYDLHHPKVGSTHRNRRPYEPMSL